MLASPAGAWADLIPGTNTTYSGDGSNNVFTNSWNDVYRVVYKSGDPSNKVVTDSRLFTDDEAGNGALDGSSITRSYHSLTGWKVEGTDIVLAPSEDMSAWAMNGTSLEKDGTAINLAPISGNSDSTLLGELVLVAQWHLDAPTDASIASVGADSFTAYRLFDADVVTETDDSSGSPVTTDTNTATHLRLSDGVSASALVAFLNATTGTAPDLAVSSGASQTYDAWLKTRYGFVDDAALDAADVNGSVRHNAQNLAEYIAGELDASEAAHYGTAGDDATKHVDASSFAYKLARHVADDQSNRPSITFNEATGDAPNKLADVPGYYLIVTGELADGPDKVGTAPIWRLVGTQANREIVEKPSLPTLEKLVAETGQDGSGRTWNKAADAEIAENTPYRLVATLPDNFGDYPAYKLVFSDTPAAGMSIDMVTPVVYWRDVDAVDPEDKALASGYEISTPNDGSGALVVTIGDVLDGVAIDGGAAFEPAAGDKLIVEYQAKIDADAAAANKGSAPNVNTATLTYSANPMDADEPTPTTSTTTNVSANLYTYKLTVNKSDTQTGEALGGVKFTLREYDPDTGAAGNYVKTNGEVIGADDAAKAAAAFTTGAADGKAPWVGLDAGTYVLTEEEASASYGTITPVVFTVNSGYNATSGAFEGLTVTNTSGGNSSLGAAPLTTFDTSGYANGEIIVNISNDKTIAMPLTGGTGLALVIGAAIIVIVASALALNCNRKRETEEEID